MRDVYIVISHSGTWFSRLIKWYTHASYTHASVSFDPELNELFSFGRKNPNNPFIGGFIIESINHGSFKRFKHTRCKVLRIQTTEENYRRLQECIDFFIEHKAYFKYNLLGLLTFLFHYPLNRHNAFFCSQFVAKVLSESQVIHLGKHPALVKPMDFTRIPGAELVYEGRLHDYNKEIKFKLNFPVAVDH